MQLEPVIWEKVEWRQGDGCYRFELQQGGLHATLTAPHGRSFTIPTVAWYALLDALAASRKTKQRSERALPPRSNARWSETEVGDVAAAFKAGTSVGALARSHNRSVPAIEAQLSRLGLWDRLTQMPSGKFAPASPDPSRVRRDTSELRPWPPDDWDSPAALAPPTGPTGLATKVDNPMDR